MECSFQIKSKQKFTRIFFGWIGFQSMSILSLMDQENHIQIQPVSLADRHWIRDFCTRRWGSDRIVARGVLFRVPELPGFLAWKAEIRLGLLTYHIDRTDLEIVTLDSLEPNLGIGSALIAATINFAQMKGHRRIWLITTNDNTPALRFYQKRGFTIAAIHSNAVQKSRKLKPEIPAVGLDGIPIRDEIELEYLLS
jgi:GNAT superfamily N-acetyltransferase